MEYAVIISTTNTAPYNIYLTLQSEATASHPKLLDYGIRYAYQNYGSNKVLDRIESYENFFALAYWNSFTSTVTICIYQRDWVPPSLAPTVPMRPMIGGFEYQYSGVGLHDPKPAFMFVPGNNAEVEIFANNPSDNQNSMHYGINSKVLQVIVTSLDFAR